MAKVEFRNLPPVRREHYIQLLLRVLEQRGLDDEGQSLVRDLIMESEVTMFARRIDIARMLLLGWSFQIIQATLRVGLQNIGAVDRWLSVRMYGYRSIVVNVRKQQKPDEGGERYDELAKQELRIRYPAQRVLIGLILSTIG